MAPAPCLPRAMLTPNEGGEHLQGAGRCCHPAGPILMPACVSHRHGNEKLVVNTTNHPQKAAAQAACRDVTQGQGRPTWKTAQQPPGSAKGQARKSRDLSGHLGVNSSPGHGLGVTREPQHHITTPHRVQPSVVGPRASFVKLSSRESSKRSRAWAALHCHSQRDVPGSLQPPPAPAACCATSQPQSLSTGANPTSLGHLQPPGGETPQKVLQGQRDTSSGSGGDSNACPHGGGRDRDGWGALPGPRLTGKPVPSRN